MRENGSIFASLYQRIRASSQEFCGWVVSCPSPGVVQKYTEQFKRPELFISINGQIVSVPVEPENPLYTAEMPLEDDYGMIDGIINNGRRVEELEKA